MIGTKTTDVRMDSADLCCFLFLYRHALDRPGLSLFWSTPFREPSRGTRSMLDQSVASQRPSQCCD